MDVRVNHVQFSRSLVSATKATNLSVIGGLVMTRKVRLDWVVVDHF